MFSATSRRTEPLENVAFLLRGCIQAAGLVCLFAIPMVLLVVWPSLPNEFAVARTIAFRYCAAGAGICASLYVLANRSWRPSPVILCFGLFVAVTGLADLLGVDPARSLHGTPLRMEGFLSPLSGAIYLGAVSVLVDKPALWRGFIAVWTCSAVVAALSGALQATDALLSHQPIPLIWGVDGQHVFLGAYMAFGVLFAAWSFSLADSRTGRALASLAGLLCVAILPLTGSRAAFMGLLAGGAGATFLVLRRVIRPWWFAATLGVMLGFGTLPLIATRLAAIPVDLGTRFTCWHAISVFVGLRPLLGWGQDNLYVVCGAEVWDRGHNLFLQKMMDGGLVALLAYLGFAASLVLALKNIPLRQSAIAIAALIAYMVMTLFEPEVITTMVPFLTFAGWIAWRSTQGGYAHG